MSNLGDKSHYDGAGHIWQSNGLVLVQDVARYLATIVPHCMNHRTLDYLRDGTKKGKVKNVLIAKTN